jgi:hypothetical protein
VYWKIYSGDCSVVSDFKISGKLVVIYKSLGMKEIEPVFGKSQRKCIPVGLSPGMDMRRKLIQIFPLERKANENKEDKGDILVL